jgi:biopolymer transport protein ExbB
MNSSNFIIDLTLFILVALSITTWSIAVIKILVFRKEARQSRQFLQAFWADRAWQQRCIASREGQGDFAKLTNAGFITCKELSGEEGEGCDHQELQEILDRELRKQMHAIIRKRERGFAELASIGSTAPFIGLFGTVWGIMNALKTITATGQASIDVVAGPIGEALIATAVGIATAIPAVLMYNYFLRQQRVHVSELDGFSEDFLRQAMRNQKQWGESC